MIAFQGVLDPNNIANSVVVPGFGPGNIIDYHRQGNDDGNDKQSY
jgi:hypothetical protein